MSVTVNSPAPYTSPSAILDLIDRYRTRGLPSPVNKDVLTRSGISDSLVPRTIQALQSLDLIDVDGAPTEQFEALRLCPESEFQGKMAEWLQATYSDIFTYVDPSTDGETAVRDAFRSYNPVGQQPRMTTLFLGLCQAAGLYTSTSKESKPRRRRKEASPSAKSPPAKKVEVRQDTQSPIITNTGVPHAIQGLVASLPREGQSWTKEKRTQFITTLGAVLDFVYPISESETANSRDGELSDGVID